MTQTDDLEYLIDHIDEQLKGLKYPQDPYGNVYTYDDLHNLIESAKEFGISVPSRIILLYGAIKMGLVDPDNLSSERKFYNFYRNLILYVKKQLKTKQFGGSIDSYTVDSYDDDTDVYLISDDDDTEDESEESEEQEEGEDEEDESEEDESEEDEEDDGSDEESDDVNLSNESSDVSFDIIKTDDIPSVTLADSDDIGVYELSEETDSTNILDDTGVPDTDPEELFDDVVELTELVHEGLLD